MLLALPTRNTIEVLNIDVDGNIDDVVLGDFLAQFDSLSEFFITSYQTDVPLPLASIMERLPPNHLRRFYFGQEDNWPNPILLDDILPRFIHLQSIIVPFDTLTTAFTNSLKRLPKLKALDLQNVGEFTQPMPYALDFSPIARILSGPTALSSLTSLDISPPLHSVSFHHLAADYRLSVDRTGAVIPNPLWKPPMWPATCSREQAKEIMRLAKEKKVEFVSEDEFRLAIENAELYEDEVAWCARQPAVNFCDI